MSYHIDTGLIIEKFAKHGGCPLCEIQKAEEEQFLHEFLNDAVMEDDCRIQVGISGFCAKHFDMLFVRQNKLSLALQEETYSTKLKELFLPAKKPVQAKKIAEKLLKTTDDCVICDLLNESMTKYYKTIAQMFVKEKDFYKSILQTNGFCVKHYAELLKYSSYAGFLSKEYLSVLSTAQKNGFDVVTADLNGFCAKHDYRNSKQPLGECETALPRLREKLFGKKYD